MNYKQTVATHVSSALAQYRTCNLCEHRCGVDRAAGELGFCKAGEIPNLFRHRIEYGEELELIPSHLFYLSGCDLRCAFCIAGINAFDPSRGNPLTSEAFNQDVQWGRQRGARNIQWVGGEPTIHLPAILQVMAGCPDLPPVVWKSDFYGTPEAFDLLEGSVDVFVADFKFGNNDCARRIAGIENYVPIVTRNLKTVSNGSKLIIRHLLLPGHAECCFQPILKWLAENLPEIPLSLRDSYLPSWRSSRFDELAFPLPPRDGKAALNLAHRLGLRVIQ
jgi:putative pyruvate formate lyase activating enzyme